jgi:hypothetical protein
VLRLGYSLLAPSTAPSPEATGLEADKLSKKHMTAYFDYYLNQCDATGGLDGPARACYLLTDIGKPGMNWTDEMIAEFAKRRGYDISPTSGSRGARGGQLGSQ